MAWMSDAHFRIQQELGLDYGTRDDVLNVIDGIRDVATQTYVQSVLDELGDLDAELKAGASGDGIKALTGDVEFHPGGKNYGLYRRQREMRGRLARLLGLPYPSATRLYRG